MPGEIGLLSPSAGRWPRPLTRGLAALALLGMGGCAAGPANPAGRGNAIPLKPPTAAAAGSRFEGNFESRLRALPETARITALVDLTDQVDLETLAADLRRRGLGKRSRREAVIRSLETVAERQQGALRPRLDRLIAEQRLDYARGLAVVNRLVVEGSAAGILAMEAWPEVATIRPDWTSERPKTVGRVEEGSDGAPGDRFESWALRAMHVDAAWERGLVGSGVTVVSVDTGVYAEHEQLRGRLAPGERGWFDPVEGSTAPGDSHGHGTTVLAQAVGGNPEGRVLGVAPAATWGAALGNWRNFYSRSRMSLVADWVLRVARPDVVLNAWSHDEGECTDFDLPFISAWKAAEMFVVFPAGNAGPGRASGEAPASLTGVFPASSPVFSVSGLGRDGRVLRASSRGPSRCGSPRFPSLAAPSETIPAPVPGNPRGYQLASGTSLSAGLIGGVAALLLQEDSELSPVELEQVLLETSRDLPPPGADDDTGAGIVDVAAAVDRVANRRSR